MLMRGYTNDLSMYLRGYFSFKSTDPSEESKMVADVDIVDTPPALERSPPFQERLRSLRRLRANDKSEFNCTIFESDLHTVRFHAYRGLLRSLSLSPYVG